MLSARYRETYRNFVSFELVRGVRYSEILAKRWRPPDTDISAGGFQVGTYTYQNFHSLAIARVHLEVDDTLQRDRTAQSVVCMRTHFWSSTINYGEGWAVSLPKCDERANKESAIRGFRIHNFSLRREMNGREMGEEREGEAHHISYMTSTTLGR